MGLNPVSLDVQPDLSRLKRVIFPIFVYSLLLIFLPPDAVPLFSCIRGLSAYCPFLLERFMMDRPAAYDPKRGGAVVENAVCGLSKDYGVFCANSFTGAIIRLFCAKFWAVSCTTVRFLIQ